MPKCQGLKINPKNKIGNNDREMLDVRNAMAQVEKKKTNKCIILISVC